MIYVRRPDEVEKIRQSARIVAEALQLAESMIRPGLRTREIDRSVEELIRARGGVPSFLGYHDFPASTCLSVNEQVVHGIPSDRVLDEGDIIGVDVGVFRDGFHGDAARTFPVGAIGPEARRLLEVGAQALQKGIDAVRPRARVGEIGYAVQTYVESQGFSVVRDLVGHGVGRKLHEDPQVPNFGPRDAGTWLREGMVLAIEPMVNQGTHEVYTLDDQWTVVTRDGKLSAHFEHTVVVTATGAEILTRL